MALTSINGVTNAPDNVVQRTQMGTVGGDHVQLGGLDAGQISAVVDDTDSLVRYGSTVGPSLTFTETAGLIASYNSTMTTLPLYAYAEMTFTGTKIGIMASVAPSGAVIQVSIDGNIWYGIAGGTGTLSTQPTLPPVKATDTTINMATAVGFPASNGLIRIGSEYILYTTFTPASPGGTFSGCTRGYGGTVAQDHTQEETIYQLGYSIDTSTSDGSVAHRQLIWYADDLPSGQHTISVVVTGTGAGAGGSDFFFDGFVTGSLLGASQIYTQIEQQPYTFTTDANGHADLGYLGVNRGDVAFISISGYTQTNCEGSNTNTMGKLGVRWASPGTTNSYQPYLYYHNGPPSTSITVYVTISYIGESIG